MGGGNISTNTRVGVGTLAANTTGINNFAIGFNSLNANTGGSISGDVSITGNLTVTGVTTYTNTTTVLIADNITTLNAAINQSGQPLVNAGIEIDRGIQPNAQFLWIETSGKWAANNGNTQIFIGADSGETYANGAFIQANAAFLQANTPDYVANSAASYANSAFLKANTPDYVANSAASYANAAFLQANTPSYTANSAATYANGAFIKANTAASTTGWSSNTILFANATGVLSNTSNLQFFASNNTVVIAGSAAATIGDAMAMAIALG